MEAADSLINRKKFEPGLIKKLGNNIYSESEQLNHLINNLLQMTYLEAEAVTLRKKLYSLKSIVAVVIKTMSKQLGNKPVRVYLPNNLPKIPFDKILIEEVFINLIDNAIKYTLPETLLEITALQEKNNVIISVEDHGQGIAPDEVSKLFEKFYRGKGLTNEKGLGLGLTICRSIIRAHGGEIWAEIRKSGGTAFRFTLPVESHSF